MSMNQQHMEQCNIDWERLCRLHNATNLPLDNDLSHHVLSFPLSFVVEKCYNYSPLMNLSKAFATYNFSKQCKTIDFQVLFLPYGYNDLDHG